MTILANADKYEVLDPVTDERISVLETPDYIALIGGRYNGKRLKKDLIKEIVSYESAELRDFFDISVEEDEK